jgi:hypothetical protein
MVVYVRMVVAVMLVLVTFAGAVVTVITFGMTKRRKKMSVGMVVPAVLVHNERQRRGKGHQEKVEGAYPQLTASSHRKSRRPSSRHQKIEPHNHSLGSRLYDP